MITNLRDVKMAEKAKPKAKAKQEVKAKPRGRPKRPIAKSMTKVPVELVFWCHDGSVFNDLRELAEGLALMSAGSKQVQLPRG